MKRAANKGRGDDDVNRLLSYFKQQLKEPIVNIVQIRKSVFLIKTDNNTYVVKGYSSYKKLKLQETFTATLRQEGFENTYLFLTNLFSEPLFFEGKYFGCIEYLYPNQKEFTYYLHSSRKEGLELLDEFHSVTTACAIRYKTLLPYSDIQKKWTERLKAFKNSRSEIRHFLHEKVLNELLEWSQWSLAGMKENEGLFLKKPHVILHGDVAHHNFLRDSSGTLNLIDFDLISIGPACIDVLQYANRILPFIDWSLEQLGRYQQIAKYLKEKAFLYALAFPTDILREWNRILRENKNPKQKHYDQVIELTLEQFDLRRKFVKELKAAVKH